MTAHLSKDHIRCKLCHKAFFTKIGLIEHKRLHFNAKTGLYETTIKEAPKKKEIVQCIICENKYQKKTELKIHVEEIHAQREKPKRNLKTVNYYDSDSS